VREYSEEVYGIPPEQVVGTAGGTRYGYDRNGRPFLTKEPKLLLNDDNAGKPEGIHLMIGRRPSLTSSAIPPTLSWTGTFGSTRDMQKTSSVSIPRFFKLCSQVCRR
jgi:hypothetical protein